MSEVVDDGVTGVLVEAGDRAGYSRALVALLTDPARVTALGRAAREAAVQRFERRAVVARYVDLYRRVLRRNGHPGDC